MVFVVRPLADLGAFGAVFRGRAHQAVMERIRRGEPRPEDSRNVPTRRITSGGNGVLVRFAGKPVEANVQDGGVGVVRLAAGKTEVIWVSGILSWARQQRFWSGIVRQDSKVFRRR